MRWQKVKWLGKEHKMRKLLSEALLPSAFKAGHTLIGFMYLKVHTVVAKSNRQGYNVQVHKGCLSLSDF